MKKCPNCLKEGEDDLFFCESCGEKLVSENENSDNTICLNCFHSNPSDSLFCESCGTSLIKNENSSPIIDALMCPSCHAPNHIGNSFCEQCGAMIDTNHDTDTQHISQDNHSQNYDLDAPSLPKKEKLAELQSQVVCDLNQVESISSTPAKKSTKAQKVLIGIILFLALALVGGFIFGKNYYSKSNQIDRFLVVFNKKDPQQLAKILISEDPNYKISEKNLAIYTDYLKKHPKYATDIASDIKKKQSLNSDIQIIQNDKYLGIFPKYEFAIKPVYRSLFTNKTGVTMYINNKKVTASDQDDFSFDTKALTPGEYKVSGKLQVGDKEEITENNYKLVRFHNDKFKEEDQIDLSIEQVKFKIASNIKQADVYVDNNKIVALNNNEAIVGPLVWHKDMSVKLVQNFTDGNEESDSYIIKKGAYPEKAFDDTKEIYITLDVGLDKNDIQLFLDGFYSDVTNYTDEYYNFGEYEKENFSNYFVNGRSNYDYKDFTDEFIGKIRKSPVKEATQGRAIVEKVTRISQSKYEVQYKIIYTTIYHKDPSIEEVFRYKKGIFTKTDENDIQIDNLGGKENFEIVS